MSDLHPYWRATGDSSPRNNSAGEQPVRVRVAGQRVSRAPAAVIGILAVLTIGLTFFQGWESLLGQAAEEPLNQDTVTTPRVHVIELSPSGMAPSGLLISAGDTIRVINNDSIPHILESTTLRDGSGVVLQTPAIFAGTAYDFTVFADEVQGDHDVRSSTTPSYSTILTLVPSGVSPPDQTYALGGLDDVPLPSGMGDSPSAAAPSRGPAPASSSSAAPAAPAPAATQSAASSAEILKAAAPQTAAPEGKVVGGIATNPYTVGADAQHAVTTESQTQKTRNTRTQLHSGANLRPPQNSSTGAEAWLVIGGSLAALLFVSRKHLRAFVQ